MFDFGVASRQKKTGPMTARQCRDVADGSGRLGHDKENVFICTARSIDRSSESRVSAAYVPCHGNMPRLNETVRRGLILGRVGDGFSGNLDS